MSDVSLNYGQDAGHASHVTGAITGPIRGTQPECDIHDGDVGDYIQLLKPRVMSLVVFTSFVGLMAAPGSIHPFLGFVAVLAIAVGAGASGALNMWYDADIDGQMQRTAARPIPRGRVSPQEALALGAVLSAFSILVLGLATNWLAGGLLALTIGFYLFVYTMWLKRRTPQNIVIGGAAGSFPPMIGWAAVTGTVSLESVMLFGLIFLWTPPHFWALSLYRCRDYERVGVPMLPVVAGPDSTRTHILIYSLILVTFSVLPAFIGLGGVGYLAASVAAGAYFLKLAVDVYRHRVGNDADKRAKSLFLYSIFYLFFLFLVLLVEAMIPGAFVATGLELKV
ncbi:MAG: protoheme IX farnesyltransferase [Rhodomicrobium sp.]|nr:MAG: protoheme IX farnesyltransferase [Rhodomicrobium sp.]